MSQRSRRSWIALCVLAVCAVATRGVAAENLAKFVGPDALAKIKAAVPAAASAKALVDRQSLGMVVNPGHVRWLFRPLPVVTPQNWRADNIWSPTNPPNFPLRMTVVNVRSRFSAALWAAEVNHRI